MVSRVCRAFVVFACVLSAVACAKGTDNIAVDLPAVNWVLDGTDLIDISEVKRAAPDAATFEGNYKTEQGGSILYLSITRTQDGWTIERTYTEPAQPKQVKQYRGKSTAFGIANSEGTIIIQSTAEGVLMFESDSGLETIPNTYWIHYLKTTKP